VKVNFLERGEFLETVRKDPQAFLARIHAPEVFIVQQFYPSTLVLELRRRFFELGLQSDPNWHPLLDDCPDYHRLHDNYSKAYVKAKMHAFYSHGWYGHNRELFDQFREVFELKCLLGGLQEDDYLHAKPSEGVVARVNFQNYPVGGGYIAEHVDPNSRFALIQTLVQASVPGIDFQRGGLFAREKLDGEKLYVDPLTAPGDLMVLSPAIPHGVDPIDPDREYNWQENAGKWTILPILVASDYPNPSYKKPQQLEQESR
jgi:hypothetical protein